MHVWTTLYFLFYVLVFSENSYNAFTLSLLMIILQYLYFLSNFTKLDKGPYQFCISCRKMTLQHYVHCSDCNSCVPVSWNHSRIMNKCASEFHISRYHTLFYIINSYIAFLLLVYGLSSNLYLFVLLVHLYIIYKCLKDSNINTVRII